MYSRKLYLIQFLFFNNVFLFDPNEIFGKLGFENNSLEVDKTHMISRIDHINRVLKSESIGLWVYLQIHKTDSFKDGT
jgi:hypothetical protein